MESKNNKTIFIILGVVAGIGIYYYLCKRNKKQIASQEQPQQPQGEQPQEEQPKQ